MRTPQTALILPIGLTSLLSLASPHSQARRPDGGLQMSPADAADHVSPELDRAMVEAVARNMAMLEKQGKLPAIIPRKVSGLAWPLGPNPGIGMDYHGISKSAVRAFPPARTCTSKCAPPTR